MSETVPGPDFSPLYRQVKDLLLQRVVSGHWKPGEILPSETKLAEEFNVSQGTVRKALEEMAAEHLVVRHQGRGTFVTARGAGAQPVHFFSMTTADHKPLGRRSNASVSHEVGPATAEEQQSLGIEPGTEVLRVFRVRSVNDEPTMLDEIVLVHARFPGFAEHVVKGPRTNAYVIMEEQYGVLAVRAEEWLCAVAAGPRQAKLLDVEPGTPLLKISRVCTALDGTPVEYRTIWVNSADCYYYNTVS